MAALNLNPSSSLISQSLLSHVSLLLFNAVYWSTIVMPFNWHEILLRSISCVAHNNGGSAPD